MKLTIEIPDGLVAELDAAIQRSNACAQAEIDKGRGASLLPGTAEDFLRREVKGCLTNFLFNDHLCYLEEQVETQKTAEADRISKALQS